MRNILLHKIFGQRNALESVFIPLNGTKSIHCGISFYNCANNIARWGDGSETYFNSNIKFDFTINPTNNNNNLIKSYSPDFNGNVEIIALRGLSDIYSLKLKHFTSNNNFWSKFFIEDFETFINQFTNLYSLVIYSYAYQNSSNMPTINGNIARIPASLEKFIFNPGVNAGMEFIGTFHLNLSQFTHNSNLKFFLSIGQFGSLTLPLSGDVALLPQNIQYFYLAEPRAGSSIIYTQGRVWNSQFDTLYLPIIFSTNGVLTAKQQNDNLLNDMAASITTAVGSKNIRLLGTRSTASDSAVTYLQGLGFTVTPATAT